MSEIDDLKRIVIDLSIRIRELERPPLGSKERAAELNRRCNCEGWWKRDLAGRHDPGVCGFCGSWD